MIVFHVMVQRFCPLQNAALCSHRDFESYLSCPLLGYYHSLVSEEGEVLRAMKDMGDFTLQGAYFGSWQIIGYLGVRQNELQAEAMQSFYDEITEAEHQYGPGINALGYGKDFKTLMDNHMVKLRERYIKKHGKPPPGFS